MPNINIKTCTETSNYDALGAIMQFMFQNYSERRAPKSRTIVCLSGRTVEVTGVDPIDPENICSCSFEVTKK